MNLILDTFIDDLFNLDSFVDCSIEGIGYGSRAVEFTDRMRALGMERLRDEHAYLTRRKHFEKLESFAKKEVSDGHPYLFALVSVKLCSILEAAVDHVLVELLKDPRTVTSSTKVSRLKGPLVEFIGATELDRMVYLREALKQEIASDLKVGVGRFESVLDALGFCGIVAPSIRKALLELHEIRNVVMHKMGKADKQFKARCPWNEIELGQSMRVTQTEYRVYHTAALWYLIELDQRWGEKMTDQGRGKEADDFLTELETEVSGVVPYGSMQSEMMGAS